MKKPEFSRRSFTTNLLLAGTPLVNPLCATMITVDTTNLHSAYTYWYDE